MSMLNVESHALQALKGQVQGPVLVPGEPAKRPYEIAMKCWDKGFYVRYGGDTIQLAPPFISTEAEIDRLVSALGDALQETA